MPRHSTESGHISKTSTKFKPRTHILFSQENERSKTSREFATDLAATLGVTAEHANEFDTGKLHDISNLILIIDGHEREPHGDSNHFFKFLADERPDLSHVHFSVFSTGNRNRIGSNVLAQRFSEKLERCKGKRTVCVFGDSSKEDLLNQFITFKNNVLQDLGEDV
ncbi:hypothetical protein GEMRC1_003870 [Eukaryota sp. GEM-RC1]